MRALDRVCVCALVCRHALEHTRPDAQVRKGLNRSNFTHRSFTCILINYKRRIITAHDTIYFKILSSRLNIMFKIDIKHEYVIIITLPLAGLA